MDKSLLMQVQRSGRRRSKCQSKHDHRCHNARQKSTESILEKGNRFRNKCANDKSEKWNRNQVGAESGSLESQAFPPLEINLGIAYEHVKSENSLLKDEVEKLFLENEGTRTRSSQIEEQNENLKADVTLMKNLVYKLNVELERYQSGGRERLPDESRMMEKLPKNYEKNFLKPVLPLLKAYGEALLEKDDVLNDLGTEYRKFNLALNELLGENEKLYEELEKKFSGPDGDVLYEVRALKKNLEMTKQENELLHQQINVEREKSARVHSMFKVKVEEISKEKENVNENMEECKADLYLLRGKYVILKQEFERLKLDNEARVPLAVHSASIDECRKLFQHLKNEYENEKLRLTTKIREQEASLKRHDEAEKDWQEERKVLEKTNLNRGAEIEGLREKISELERRLEKIGGAPLTVEERRKLSDSQRQLRESNRKVDDLNNKLSVTRKQLQKAMMFAEEIVRGQEGLLLQLHAKQKENNYMTSHFGSLKNQLKEVERGAQQGLNSVEEKIRSLEAENYALAVHNRKLQKLLSEKETNMKDLQPAKDT